MGDQQPSRGAVFRLAAFLVSCLPLATVVEAQNTGGVFGPIVNADDRVWQYRITFDPDTDGWAQRLHYEQAPNTDLMWRGVVQTRKTADSDTDFDYFQGELFWELSDDDDAWKTGLRFDFRLRDGDRPGTFGLNWMNQWTLAEGLSARFLVLTTVDFGDNTRDGVGLQTRGSLFYRSNPKLGLGLELYNSYGSTDRIADFDDQRHQLGPTALFRLAEGRNLYTNVLFGLTDSTPDTELRLWFTLRL